MAIIFFDRHLPKMCLAPNPHKGMSRLQKNGFPKMIAGDQKNDRRRSKKNDRRDDQKMIAAVKRSVLAMNPGILRG